MNETSFLKTCKTIFYGTSTFGLPALRWLAENTDLVAVFTTPDKPAGRGNKLEASAVSDTAQAFKGVPVLKPDNLKAPDVHKGLEALQPAVAIVASYGKIMPESVLDIPKYGSVNIHPSLLPKYRGAVPIQAALLAGDDRTGITLIRMDAGIDTGPIIAQRGTPIYPEESFQILHDRLASESAALLEECLPQYVEGLIQLRLQDNDTASYVPKLHKDDGRLQWSNDPMHITRQVKALNPWPGTWAEIKERPGERIKILAVTIDQDGPTLKPGQCLAKNGHVYVGTATLPLKILELQQSGKRRMTGKEFAAGLKAKQLFLV